MKLTLLSFSFLLAVIATPRSALADYIQDGNSLKRNCAYTQRAVEPDGKMTGEVFVCVGYISGVIDGYNQAGAKVPLCYPDGVSMGQLTDVVVLFLKNHPELLHRPAAYLVLRAISKRFPARSSHRGWELPPAPTSVGWTPGMHRSRLQAKTGDRSWFLANETGLPS